MRRRHKSEIQAPVQAANDRDYDMLVQNYPDIDKNYDLLIPKYPNIEYNDKYNSVRANQSISTSNYDRDNYYIIPYKVPPMTFTGKAYPLDWSSMYSVVPRVSISRGVNYNKDIWTDDGTSNLWVNATYDTFSSIVLRAYPGFEGVLNASMYVCTSEDGEDVCIRNTGYPDYINNPSIYQCGPIDTVDTGYLGISDAFAYAWSDSWDINLVARPVKYSKKTKKDESGSSGSQGGGVGGGALLCKIVSAPSSAGGTATVQVISVNAAGGVSAGSSMTVNVPAI